VASYDIFSEIDKIKIENMPKFDVVVGNPPYQTPKSSGGGLGGNQSKLYVKFVQLSIRILKDGGYLCFIHPGNWRCGMSRITKQIGNLLKSKQIDYLNINKAKQYFNVGSRFDWYVLKNVPNYKNTQIETEYGEVNINLNNYKIIPNILNEIALSVFEKTIFNNKIDKIGNKLFYSDERMSAPSKEKTKEYLYPFMIPGEKNQKIRWYGLKKHPLQDNYKIFFSTTGDGGSLYLGKDYGTSGIFGNLVILCSNKTEVDNYYSFFNSKLFRFIVKAVNFNRFYNYALNELIPDPKISMNWTEQNLYEYFNLTQEEIDYIESQII